MDQQKQSVLFKNIKKRHLYVVETLESSVKILDCQCMTAQTTFSGPQEFRFFLCSNLNLAIKIMEVASKKNGWGLFAIGCFQEFLNQKYYRGTLPWIQGRHTIVPKRSSSKYGRIHFILSSQGPRGVPGFHPCVLTLSGELDMQQCMKCCFGIT